MQESVAHDSFRLKIVIGTTIASSAPVARHHWLDVASLLMRLILFVLNAPNKDCHKIDARWKKLIFKMNNEPYRYPYHEQINKWLKIEINHKYPNNWKIKKKTNQISIYIWYKTNYRNFNKIKIKNKLIHFLLVEKKETTQ